MIYSVNSDCKYAHKFVSISNSFMTRKLYALVLGECVPESPDCPMNQEVLLGGHLYLMVLKVCERRLLYPQ